MPELMKQKMRISSPRAWQPGAHRVRLDANSKRHVDENEPLPTTEDARRSIAFVKALAEFLFVLPAKVSEGLQESEPS